MKKIFFSVLITAVIVAFGISAVSASAATNNKCKAAPAVATELLREKQVKPKVAGKDNFVSQVAKHMGPGKKFDGVEACNTVAYRNVINLYLDQVKCLLKGQVYFIDLVVKLGREANYSFSWNFKPV